MSQFKILPKFSQSKCFLYTVSGTEPYTNDSMKHNNYPYRMGEGVLVDNYSLFAVLESYINSSDTKHK